MVKYYLDNAATTKVFDEIVKDLTYVYNEKFYNPSSVYKEAVEIKKEIELARTNLLACLGDKSGNLIFTGSATEANNMVVLSNKNLKGKRFLFGAGEHPSVKNSALELKNLGYNVQFIPLESSGRVNEIEFAKMLGKDVAFVSIQHVSNETGAFNNISKLVKLAKRANDKLLFHSDGVQAFMKLSYNIQNLGVDYYTISAHKIGGPKGVGALYIKNGVKIPTFIFGGGQEYGYRSGTENVFGMLAFSKAASICYRDLEKNRQIIAQHRNDLLSELKNLGIEYSVNGDSEGMHILSICLSEKVRGETLLYALSSRGVLVSTGSACSAGKHMNTTLEAMGVCRNKILSSIRISFSAYMDFDAKVVCKIIKEELIKLEDKSYE